MRRNYFITSSFDKHKFKLMRFLHLPFWLIIVVLFANITSCNTDDKAKKKSTDSNEINEFNDGALVKINDRLFSIPSPVQVAISIKENKIAYTKNLLHDPNKINNYSTNFKKALNMGILGADLAYIQIYEQYPDAPLFFAGVKKLGEELGISAYFNKATLDRIEANNNNKDSLIAIMGSIYRNIDNYMFQNDRNIVGILLLTGGWLETLHLLTQMYKSTPNQNILNRIGEQKYPLDNLIALLRPYYGTHSKEVDLLIQALINLAIIYDGVEIKYSFVEPTTDDKQKLTIINSMSKVIISEYQLKTITENLTTTRKSITD